MNVMDAVTIVVVVSLCTPLKYLYCVLSSITNNNLKR